MARAAHWNRVYTTKGPTDVSWFEPRGIPTWIEADATGEWTSGRMQLWHDRAVFHFLTQPDDRARYRQHLLDTLARELGDAFVLEDARAHVHTTPWGRAQSFQYSRLRRRGVAVARDGHLATSASSRHR